MYEKQMSYATVKIPKPLADRIDELVSDITNDEGYRSRAEFVNTAIRELLGKQEQGMELATA